MNIAIIAALVLFGSFIILLVIGVPISVSIGVASLLTASVALPFDVIIFTASQRMLAGINSFLLLAVIFFILAGSIMNNGGIAIRLINLAQLMTGRIPGSLAHTNVVANMLFGSISGSAIAAASAIGTVMSPIQEKEGYDPSFSAAVNIASAPTGLLIPPSGLLILYSMVSGGTSITTLFIAGYLPGILMGLAVMIVVYRVSKKENYVVEGERPTAKEAMKIVLDAIPSLLLIVIVIGGIVGGIFTATEGAAVAVLYSMVLSMIYKSISLKMIPQILKETFFTTSTVLFLVAASSIMSWAMSVTRIPMTISNMILGLSDNKIIVLAIIVFILLAVGTFMDAAPAILIFTPIFLPVITHLGVDTVHFGILLMVALSIGVITPPVGSVLFVGCSVANVTIESVIPKLIPMFVALIIALLFIVYIPNISLLLPKLLGLL